MLEPVPSRWAPWRWPLPAQVGLGIGVGVLLGCISASLGRPTAARWDIAIYGLLGKLFMQALSLIVVPLIASALIVAVSGFGEIRGFARIGGKVLLYYLGTGLVAILVGVALVTLVRPGATELSAADVHTAVTTAGSSEAQQLASIQSKTAGRGIGDFLGVFLDLVPANIIDAAARGQTLGVILFATLFGLLMTRLEGRPRETLAAFWQGVYEVMLGMTRLVMALLPIGVCVLIAKTTADTVADERVAERLGQLAKFTGVVLAGLAIHALVVIPLVVALIARVDPRRHLRAMAPAMLTAFSTSSSNATLAVTLDCLERRAGVSKRVTSVVVPVGANVNSDGTALYECVVVLFLAQFYGIELGMAEQLLVVAYALATSIGVAGIPSASLVAIVVIINAVNQRLSGAQIPVEGLAVILVVDRLLDMCRTAVNVLGDATCAVVVARSEGEGVLGAAPRGAVAAPR